MTRCDGLVSFRHGMVQLSARGTELGQALHEGMGIERECVHAPDVVTPKTAATSALSPLSSAAVGV